MLFKNHICTIESIDEIFTDLIKLNQFVNHYEGDKRAIYETLTEAQLINIVKIHPYELRFINNQTEEVCKEAIKKQPGAISHAKNQTDSICELLFKEKGHGLYLSLVQIQTPRVCRAAVVSQYQAMELIEDQNEEICKFAVKHDIRAYRYIREPSEKLNIYLVKSGKPLEEIIDQTFKVCKAAIQRDPFQLDQVRNQTPDICLIGLKVNPKVFQFVRIVPNPDLATTQKNLLTKKEIMKALRD